MPTITTGRTLDRDGRPIEGTGFAFEHDSRLAELLSQRTTPVYSQPDTGEWVFALVAGSDTGGEFERGVGVFRPGNAGPPRHLHPSYDEYFELLQGECVFEIGGETRRLRAGDRLVVPKGTPHTFRCVGDECCAALVETRPAGEIGALIATLFGLAHDGKLTPRGVPKFLQAMVIGSELADNTVFTSPPPAVAVPLARLLAPLARRLGHRATYPEYLEATYWATRVEQPDGMPNAVSGGA